jgi:hypothetical protein
MTRKLGSFCNFDLFSTTTWNVASGWTRMNTNSSHKGTENLDRMERPKPENQRSARQRVSNAEYNGKAAEDCRSPKRKRQCMMIEKQSWRQFSREGKNP